MISAFSQIFATKMPFYNYLAKTKTVLALILSVLFVPDMINQSISNLFYLWPTGCLDSQPVLLVEIFFLESKCVPIVHHQ